MMAGIATDPVTADQPTRTGKQPAAPPMTMLAAILVWAPAAFRKHGVYPVGPGPGRRVTEAGDVLFGRAEMEQAFARRPAGRGRRRAGSALLAGRPVAAVAALGQAAASS
jgi:hypothetical protein